MDRGSDKNGCVKRSSDLIALDEWRGGAVDFEEHVLSPSSATRLPRGMSSCLLDACAVGGGSSRSSPGNMQRWLASSNDLQGFTGHATVPTRRSARCLQGRLVLYTVWVRVAASGSLVQPGVKSNLP